MQQNMTQTKGGAVEQEKKIFFKGVALVLDQFQLGKTKKEARPHKRFSLGGSKKRKRREAVLPKNLILGLKG